MNCFRLVYDWLTFEAQRCLFFLHRTKRTCTDFYKVNLCPKKAHSIKGVKRYSI